MSELETIVEEPDRLDDFDGEEPVVSSESESQPAKPSAYGAPLPPFDPEGAIAVLESFYEGDAEEQRETFEYLKRALNETRVANGERLLFPDEVEESVASSDEAEKVSPAQRTVSGIALQPIDVEAALRALAQLDEFDVEEQRETFEYLEQALNETRAANEERLLFP